ncbi:CRISPR-associated endoribonuclease Cas6 [Lachnobacterium bovis]|uniref:CRISPR-associated endoribonuclease Cas6 n=1 Tax=Lachnobacterium bovis TaxID=140626 RepID=A0A1H9S540_9FIRM|nr:CRISPR-associated endoribonuclease Cas6 [Lachnobacterium bovis]SER80090.1 CRISPR-associated endoribonuclease Cas6 [Lachnobacterium bovis]
MKITMVFRLEKSEINKDWRRLFLSYLKARIEEENEEYFESMYSEGKTIQKPFCFWGFLPGLKFEDDVAKIQGHEVKFYVSSTDIKFLFMLNNACLKEKNKKYPLANKNYMCLVDSKISKTKEIDESEIIIKMLSPLVCRKHNRETNRDLYFLPEEEGFEETLNDILQKKFYSSTDVPKIEVLKTKKVVIKAYSANIPSSLGVFRLKGNIAQLNELYLNGLGSKTASGFGKFELIN